MDGLILYIKAYYGEEGNTAGMHDNNHSLLDQKNNGTALQ